MQQPTQEQRRELWSMESDLKDASQKSLRQYERGLLTHEELIAELMGIRLSRAGWTNAGSTFPVETIGTYARFVTWREQEKANL